MDAFVSRKRRKVSMEDKAEDGQDGNGNSNGRNEEESTDEKLAILSSVFEQAPQDDLMEALLNHDGSVEMAMESLLVGTTVSSAVLSPSRKTSTNVAIQSSLKFIRTRTDPDYGGDGKPPGISKSLTRKGKTLYLYSPEDIAKHTPCSIIHNFLSTELANSLLRELLPETESFTSASFRLFDNVVKSPHTASFYVNSLADVAAQRSNYLYNGSTLSDVREILPVMRQVSSLIDKAVNAEIAKRVETYPGGVKLKHQPPGPWIPNAAFVNCYDGAQQSVGYHTDQLSYLGPHPVIGSLSLGVQREFRIRRIIPPPDLDGLDSESPEAKKLKDESADAQGQIALPLPHNSLLVMHAEMQETWKHSIAPASNATGGITPHPIAGNKRINITYRWYREEFSPKYTPKCRCGVPCVLKSVMRRKETLGRYVWMCQTVGRVTDERNNGGVAGDTKEQEKSKGDGVEKVSDGKGCGYFDWAEFDDDGLPMWLSKEKAKEKEARQIRT